MSGKGMRKPRRAGAVPYGSARGRNVAFKQHHNHVAEEV